MVICERGATALLHPCVDTDWPLSRYGYGERYVKGTANKSGRSRRGLYLRAHIFALEQILGRPLRPGMQANHHCDNRACIQPEHLYEGTQSQNVQDMWDRKRAWSPFAHGGLVGNPRVLTEDQEREMTARYVAGGVSQVQLARDYGISQPTISRVIIRHRSQTE